ncbi:MAG: glycosyltransferase family 39 protein [Gemmatimonadetes bacterium]|nr:glycosyltransferase family 39 protein [Gemmatimonadota bacterium]
MLRPPVMNADRPNAGRRDPAGAPPGTAAGTGGTAAMIGRLPGRLPSIDPGNRLPLPEPEGRDIARPLAWLAGLTVIGAALRIRGLGGELWLDEILTVSSHAGRSIGELVLAPGSLNSHLLHTLLAHGSIALFGAEEWAIRLPAVVFGIATIPAVYALARVALRSREALLASGLVAVSYHHVLFSQNARGYSGLLLWTALSTLFLVRALTRDRGRDWALYLATGLLAAFTMLLGALVPLGHLATLPAVGLRLHRAGASPRPAVAKAALAAGAVCLAAAVLYAAAVPTMIAEVDPSRPRWTRGEEPFGFWYELTLGLRAGFGPLGILALLAAASLTVGGFRLARRHSVYVALLVAPLVPTAALAAVGFWVAPRFFLWSIPAAAIALVAAASMMGRASRWVVPATVSLVAVASLWALPRYYATPKQAVGASAEWVQRRSAAGEPVVAVSLAVPGIRFYAPRVGLDARRVEEASELEELLAIERRAGGRRIWMLTTHRRFLFTRQPALLEHIERCYRPLEEFPATIHRMEIMVWVGGCPAVGSTSRGRPAPDPARSTSGTGPGP